jgi:hypothetical protein
MNSYNINKKVNIYLHQMTVHRVDKSNSDSLCPICLNLLNVILEEEQVAIAMDSPAYPIEDLGVTMLSQTWQCGHIFCRRELGRLFFCVFFFFRGTEVTLSSISKWIQEAVSTLYLEKSASMLIYR